MKSGWHLHRDAGVSTGPWCEAIRARYGVAEFSQFQGGRAVADRYGLSLDGMGAFALDRHRKAAAAVKTGAFSDEIAANETVEGRFDADDGARRGGTMKQMAAVRTLRKGSMIALARSTATRWTPRPAHARSGAGRI